MFCGLLSKCGIRKKIPEEVIKSTNVFEQYEPNKKVGRGTYGEVWKSYDKKTGKCVAIKFSTTPVSNASLAREYKFLEMFNHECIIKSLDFYRLTEMYQLVLPFYKHDMLDHVCDSDRISNKDIGVIAHRIGSAIRYMHSKHICHRDIKPENIMFNKSINDCVLIDFGLAKHEDHIDSATVCGSLVYIAPEVANAVIKSQHNSFLVGKMADMYAFGCTLYTIATKSYTIDISKSTEMYKIITNDMTLRINALNRPESFKNLLHCLLCIDPLNRITADEMMQHEYFNLTAC